MMPMRIEGATRRLAETQDEYRGLSIKDETIEGVPMMTSLWEPTPFELNQLLLGGAVRLTIIGTEHPPVLVTTQLAPKWMPDDT